MGHILAQISLQLGALVLGLAVIFLHSRHAVLQLADLVVQIRHPTLPLREFGGLEKGGGEALNTWSSYAGCLSYLLLDDRLQLMGLGRVIVQLVRLAIDPAHASHLKTAGKIENRE